MESVLDTPPSEDNVGEMCFGECKDKIEKLKKDFLMLKKKIFCSQDLIKKYNDKIKENEQMTTNIQTLQLQLKSIEKKLNKRNIAVQSDAVRLQLENDKLRKSTEDVAKLREEYEIKIAGDKQYIQQLVCKLKEVEDQHLEKLMKLELEKSGLQGKVKELEREIRNLHKNNTKTDSVSPNKTKEPKKRGKKLNNQKTEGLPVLENDLDCIDIGENHSKSLVSECDNTISQEKYKENSSTNIEVKKPIDVPEIIDLENEFKINVSSLEYELPKKPICIDKNIMTDEYYNFEDDPYPLFCNKCRTLLDANPVDEILNAMQMRPLITEFSKSPVRERNEMSPVVHSNISMNGETLEKKLKKLEKQVSKMKKIQNSYKNVSHCNHSHVNSWCRDNSMNDNFSMMNMMTTFFNAMYSNKKRKKNRTKRLQHCEKKIYRRKNNHVNNNWDVESLPCDLNNAENADIDSELLHVPIYTPLINRSKKNRHLSCSTTKNDVKNPEEINDHQTENYNTEVEKIRKVPKKCKKKQKNDHDHIEHQKNNDDYSEYQKHNNDHTVNQRDGNDIINDDKESSNVVVNIEKTVDLDPSIDDSENNQTKSTEKANEITPIEKSMNDIHHEKKNLSYDINTRLNDIYSPDATSIGLISPSSLNTCTVKKRKKGSTNINTVSVKSTLLTKMRQLKSKSTKLPAKIFRNENLDNIERTEELNETPIKKKRIAHVPKQDCFDDTDDKSAERSSEEQSIINRLRVTRSMAKSSLSPNISLEKESQNSPISKENSIINKTTAVIDDYSSGKQDNENLHENQTTLDPALDPSERTHSNGQEKKDSDKTQGLNNNCENEILSKSYEVDNIKEERSLEKVSKVKKIDIKNSDMLIDLEELMENEINEGIALEDSPELFDESSVSSDQRLEQFPVLLEQEEFLILPELETEKCPASSDLTPKESPMLEKLPSSLDPKHNITEISPKLTRTNVLNNPVPSNEFTKRPMSKNDFYKDCVINLRNRTVAISPLKTTHDNNSESFTQNNSSKPLLDQYIDQKKPKPTKKWSKFHHEAAMKLAKGAEEYVKMELKNLIDAETWTSLVNEQIVNNLKAMNNRSIAKSVVEFLIELSDLKEPLDRTFTPPAPMMTKNQQKIVAFLKKLDGLKNIIIDVLNNIEYAIFNMNSDITYEATEELARIFTVLAKIKKDRERVRIMCCDALYCFQKKGMFVLSAVITSWPEVLPSHQEDRFQYLPACIAYAVKTFKHGPNDVCTKIMQLNKLIRNIYKYPDEFLTSKSFVEKLLTDLMIPDHDRSVSTAIILLSKKEGSEWTFKNIISGGLLGMIVENKSSNVREALKLLGYLMKSFPIDDQSGTVKKIIDQLCAILDSGATSTDIQEGVVFALLSLSRHNFNQVAKSISMWQPSQNLSSELKEQLTIFFDLRTLNFWKQFKKKKKCNKIL